MHLYHFHFKWILTAHRFAEHLFNFTESAWTVQVVQSLVCDHKVIKASEIHLYSLISSTTSGSQSLYLSNCARRWVFSSLRSFSSFSSELLSFCRHRSLFWESLFVIITTHVFAFGKYSYCILASLFGLFQRLHEGCFPLLRLRILEHK